MHSQPNDFALQSEEIWLPKMVQCVYCSVQAAAVDWEQGGSCLSLPAMYLAQICLSMCFGRFGFIGINSQKIQTSSKIFLPGRTYFRAFF